MSSRHAHGEPANANVSHEESDINVRAIITFVIVLTVITAGIQGAMVGMFKLLNLIETKSQPTVSPLAAGPAQTSDFPSPSLQTTPWQDLQKLRAGEHTFLHTYGWVDESAGIARIPIDKAKEMLLQKGLPVRADAVTDATQGTHYATTGESSGGRNLKAGGADLSGMPAPAANPSAAPANATVPPTAGAPPKKPGDAAPKAGGGAL